MTLNDVIVKVQENFIGAKSEDICQLVNELESCIKGEIFSPLGISARETNLDCNSDLNTSLLLEREYLSLYADFIFSKLSHYQGDIEGSNGYSKVFSARYKELSVKLRRGNRPIKKSRIYGRGIK